ncbi:MAG: GNAT family acetyltransferase [Thermobacillus sp. ZCTH02-B1]|uniref:GNAT family N-acetyltransferase n=1 Tax=Thermobacillus sp. ZCTH02-B1 TaxID=1858795 RepID=UPI000B57ECFE|nr:GNAT family N-acetyltransferase [Thermobacillus sp. ZCTH02-B1]OUM95566.1 MAG: GNAT family acetyltransferase [Thermobacillus sp. ZCTH02-B1]
MTLSFQLVTTEEEIGAVARLASEIWREHYINIITAEQIEYMLDKFQSVPAISDQIKRQGYEYYLMLVNGNHAGYLAVRPEPSKLFLSKFYLLKAYRGQGYGGRAIRFLEELCRERGLKAIWLTVNRHNASSIAVYEHSGFRTVRTQVADIGGGFVMDDYVMEKEVSPA